MKHALIALLLASSAAQVAVAEDKPADTFLEEFEKFSDEAQEFFGSLAESIAPMLEGLQERMGDLSQYEKPEILPNGDIIIRRKQPVSDTEEKPDGQVDL